MRTQSSSKWNLRTFEVLLLGFFLFRGRCEAVDPIGNGSSGEGSRRMVRIAYFIQVSPGHLKHLERLLRVLHRAENVYAVHVDAKEDTDAVISFIRALRNGPRGESFLNVHFMDGEEISYRGLTMTLNTIRGMEFLLEKDSSWDYFINLSANDYPMVTVENQQQLLGSENILGRKLNFMTFFSKKSWQTFNVKRQFRIHLDTGLTFSPGGQMIPTYYTSPLFGRQGFTFAKAEAWITVTREFCAEVVHGAMMKRLLANFSFLLSSPEHVFVTLLFNHPYFNTTWIPRGFTTVLWITHQNKGSGQHPVKVDQIVDGEYVYFDTLIKRPGFFARKFELANTPIMDRIDREVSGYVPDAEHQASIEEYLKSLYEVVFGYIDRFRPESHQDQ
mmetsp:Transcript_1706/g.3150  ORF Transcript_1706/g.3150 Transcript_1706/m.3150 type:complete len:388 (+) Transcript_1706:2968-4131(+)